MLARLVSTSCPQVVCPPWPPKVLGLQGCKEDSVHEGAPEHQARGRSLHTTLGLACGASSPGAPRDLLASYPGNPETPWLRLSPPDAAWKILWLWTFTTVFVWTKALLHARPWGMPELSLCSRGSTLEVTTVIVSCFSSSDTDLSNLRISPQVPTAITFTAWVSFRILRIFFGSWSPPSASGPATPLDGVGGAVLSSDREACIQPPDFSSSVPLLLQRGPSLRNTLPAPAKSRSAQSRGVGIRLQWLDSLPHEIAMQAGVQAGGPTPWEDKGSKPRRYVFDVRSSVARISAISEAFPDLQGQGRGLLGHLLLCQSSSLAGL
ncbi:LOW QUALITY PROTEIN: hypothetical protein AAY473_004352 [Plecturocebus cupreus]